MIKRIAITGAAGQIAYQFLFRAAAGEVFGKQQRLAFHLLETQEALPALEGVKMELEDGAYSLLDSVEISSDPFKSFQDVEYALLIGAKPRTKGMERKDLLTENGHIFFQQGKALNEVANQNVKVIVVGNPCNTNCLISLHQASRLNIHNFYAMMRLDHNRAINFLAKKAKENVSKVSKMTIWGNHSSTQVPDYYHAEIGSQKALDVIQNEHWLKKDFIELVRQRGAEIIDARGKSSAASAAEALIQTIVDINQPTVAATWFSIAQFSQNNNYGIDKDLIFSFPSRTNLNKETEIVEGLDLNFFLLEMIKESEKELLSERDAIKHLLKN